MAVRAESVASCGGVARVRVDGEGCARGRDAGDVEADATVGTGCVAAPSSEYTTNMLEADHGPAMCLRLCTARAHQQSTAPLGPLYSVGKSGGKKAAFYLIFDVQSVTPCSKTKSRAVKTARAPGVPSDASAPA